MADKIGEPRPTYQAWESGRIQFPPLIQEKIIKLGYDGPFPEGNKEVTQEDLQALGRDLLRVQNHAHEDLKRDIQALGAALQELLKRSEVSK